MDTLQNKFIFCLITIFIHCNQARTCIKDCSFQAGAPCEIISSDDECPTVDRDESLPYPTQPEFNIFPITDETDTIKLNVTWKYGLNNSGILRGYEIKYWKYEEVGDASISILDKCVLFNMTSDIQPSIKALFYHTCNESPTRYIQLAALPQIAPHKDYVHRVTAGFSQDYGDSPAYWQPKLVVIHNDSCNGVVDVQFDLAPTDFHFRKYKIGLSCLKSQQCETQSQELHVSEVDEKGHVIFLDVKDGKYSAIIVAEPNDRGNKCYCSPNPCYHGCVYSETGAFIIETDHLKCSTDASTEFTPTTGDKQEIITLVVVLALITVFVLLIMLLITVIRIIRTNDKKTSNSDPSDGLTDVIEVYNKNGSAHIIENQIFDSASQNTSTSKATSYATKQLRMNNDIASDIVADNQKLKSNQVQHMRDLIHKGHDDFDV